MGHSPGQNFMGLSRPEDEFRLWRVGSYHGLTIQCSGTFKYEELKQHALPGVLV